jgi:hypothetical protein
MTKNIVSQKRNKRKHEILGEVIKVNGRTIGQVIGDTGYKDVSRKKHFLHYPEEAIAFTIAALHAMQAAGAVYVDILDTDNGIRYKTTIQKYFEYGEKINLGWGEQIKLTLPNFTQTRDPEFIESQTDSLAYSVASETNDVMPLYYKSNAPTGVTVNGVKQPPLFGDGD